MYTTMYTQGRMYTAQYTLYYVHTYICWIHTQYMMYTYIHYTIHRDTCIHTIHVYYWIIIKQNKTFAYIREIRPAAPAQGQALPQARREQEKKKREKSKRDKDNKRENKAKTKTIR